MAKSQAKKTAELKTTAAKAVKNTATAKIGVRSATSKANVKGSVADRRRAKPPTTSTPAKKWHPELRTRFVTEVAGGTRRAAHLLDVAASQPSRWMAGESTPGPAQARMLLDIDHVLAHALLVWADVGVARDWLTTANANLDGIAPLEWIRRHGTAEVVEALRAEAAGAYP
ncbi:MAG TPA: hypothetical protein VNA57_14275 [Acidimicrobiales bacterium]|nr:hypothetical protein [Acidimicrobiales bacterium]